LEASGPAAAFAGTVAGGAKVGGTDTAPEAIEWERGGNPPGDNRVATPTTGRQQRENCCELLDSSPVHCYGQCRISPSRPEPAPLAGPQPATPPPVQAVHRRRDLRVLIFLGRAASEHQMRRLIINDAKPGYHTVRGPRRISSVPACSRAMRRSTRRSPPWAKQTQHAEMADGNTEADSRSVGLHRQAGSGLTF